MRSAVIRQLHGLSVGARLGTQSNLHERSVLAYLCTPRAWHCGQC